MTGWGDRWIRWTTTVCVALLALIAGKVSYLHMHLLVELHRQPGWVAASTTLLAESKSGRRGRILPWGLLVAGSVASLAANVAVAEPTLIGRVIAAWPSFALTASYELLTGQVRRNATAHDGTDDQPRLPPLDQRGTSDRGGPAPKLTVLNPVPGPESALAIGRRELQRQAWQWALARQASCGALPTRREIAREHGRHERWGRLVKSAGRAGELAGHDLAKATADGAMPTPTA